MRQWTLGCCNGNNLQSDTTARRCNSSITSPSLHLSGYTPYSVLQKAHIGTNHTFSLLVTHFFGHETLLLWVFEEEEVRGWIFTGVSFVGGQ